MSISYKRFRNRLSGEDIVPDATIDENKLKDMSKTELDEYAKENENIELDRRKSKKNMINEFLTKLKGEK